MIFRWTFFVLKGSARPLHVRSGNRIWSGKNHIAYRYTWDGFRNESTKTSRLSYLSAFRKKNKYFQPGIPVFFTDSPESVKMG